jgi:hypothetical protein
MALSFSQAHTHTHIPRAQVQERGPPIAQRPHAQPDRRTKRARAAAKTLRNDGVGGGGSGRSCTRTDTRTDFFHRGTAGVVMVYQMEPPDGVPGTGTGSPACTVAPRVVPSPTAAALPKLSLGGTGRLGVVVPVAVALWVVVPVSLWVVVPVALCVALFVEPKETVDVALSTQWHPPRATLQAGGPSRYPGHHSPRLVVRKGHMRWQRCGSEASAGQGSCHSGEGSTSRHAHVSTVHCAALG